MPRSLALKLIEEAVDLGLQVDDDQAEPGYLRDQVLRSHFVLVFVI